MRILGSLAAAAIVLAIGATPAFAQPKILDARFAERPVAGLPAVLEVRVRDPLAAVNGIRVDFGDGAMAWESACRPLWEGVDLTGPFTPGRGVTMRIAHVYREVERRTIRITAHAGDCTSGLEVARTELGARVRALPLNAIARPAAVPLRIGRAAQQAGCADPYSIGGADLGRRIRCTVNVVRSGQGLPQLRPSRRLGRAARRHAADMVRRGYFSHVTPEGVDLITRLRRARVRLRGNFFGENLAAGTGDYASPIGMLLSWLESPAHAANLLDSGFNRAGYGVASGMPGERAPDAATAVQVLAGS